MPQAKRKVSSPHEGLSKRLQAVEAFVAKSRVEFETWRQKDAKQRAAEEAKRRAEEAKWRTAIEAEEAKRRTEEAKWRTAMEAEEAKRRTEEAKRRAEEAKRREAAEAAEAKRREAAEAAEAKRQAEEAKRREANEAAWSKRSEEVNNKIDKLVGGVQAKLAALAEDLVSRFLVPLLKERGIAVEYTARNLDGTFRGGEFEGRLWEIDNIAVNGGDVVIGEVKSRLRVRDVRRFVKRTLQQIEYMTPEHKDKNIYGSMAALQIDPKAFEVANELGLFVIRLTSGSAEVVNAKNFKPKKY